MGKNQGISGVLQCFNMVGMVALSGVEQEEKKKRQVVSSSKCTVQVTVSQ